MKVFSGTGLARQHTRIAENHKQIESRNTAHRSFGYDITKSIRFVMSKSLPLKGRILEIGTGKGRFTAALARSLKNLDTVDLNRAEVESAFLYLAWHRMNKRVRFHVGDAVRLPWKDGYFDVVVSMNVVHHMRAPMRVVSEMLRVVGTGGKVVLADFDRTGFRLMASIQRREGRVHPGGRVSLRDIRRRFAGQVRKTSGYCGFKQEIVVLKK